MDIVGKFYIYKETAKHNQLNDKHNVQSNKMFETIHQVKCHMT